MKLIKTKVKNRKKKVVFPLQDAPGAITLNVVWMGREFDAYKLSRGIYFDLRSTPAY